MYINPLEHVFPCCIGDPSLNMRDLKKKSFAKIWNGYEYRALRRRMFEQRLTDYCSHCKFYSLFPDDRAFDLRNLFEPPSVT